jgi:hypothetical protein
MMMVIVMMKGIKREESGTERRGILREGAGMGW